MPTRVGAALTVCMRGWEPMSVIEWCDLDEALDAVMTLFDRPCAARCRSDHVLVFTDATAIHVRRVVGPSPQPPDLAEELLELYPPRLNGNGHGTFDSTPELWPRPRELNEPLRPQGAPVNHRSTARHGAASARSSTSP